MKELILRLYMSEINVNVSAEWDNGIKIGFGFKNCDGEFHYPIEELSNIEKIILKHVFEIYPNSLFTNMYKAHGANTEFELVVFPLIEYMAKNHHPHKTLLVTNSRAELVEGQTVVQTYKFIGD